MDKDLLVFVNVIAEWNFSIIVFDSWWPGVVKCSLILCISVTISEIMTSGIPKQEKYFFRASITQIAVLLVNLKRISKVRLYYC